MNIDVLVLHDRLDYRDAEITRTAAIYHAQKELGASIYVPPLERQATVHTARNTAINAMREPTDYVLMADDDMGLADPMAIVKMVRIMEEHQEYGAITPLTVKRTLPVAYASSYLEDYNGNLRATPVTPDLLRDADYGLIAPVLGGGGFFMMRGSVAVQALTAHLEARDWEFDHAVQLRRLGVSKFRMEEERKYISESRLKAYEDGGKRQHTLFNFPYDSDCTFLHGEDWAFTLFLYRLGIKTVLAADIWVQHLGIFPYSPALLGARRWDALEMDKELQGVHKDAAVVEKAVAELAQA